MAYLYVIGDEGYLARRDAALREAFERRGLEPEVRVPGKGDGDDGQAETCENSVVWGRICFRKR